MGQKKTCGKIQHVRIVKIQEMPNLICGKSTVGGNYNSTYDNEQFEKYFGEDGIKQVEQKSLADM